MQFSEYDLVDMLDEQMMYVTHGLFHNFVQDRTYDYRREFVLPSGRRIDYLAHSKCFRQFLLVEAKVVVDVSAIRQAIEYKDELLRSKLAFKSNFSLPMVAIAGQFFKDDALFFAEQMGIICIHIAPYSADDATVAIKVPHKIRWYQNSLSKLESIREWRAF